MTELTAAEKLVIVEQELSRLRAEYDAFRQALRGSDVVAWVDGEERMPPRPITQMEAATIRHLKTIEPQIRNLEKAEAFLLVRTLDETAGRPSIDGLEDPEALLRASLVCLAHAWKDGHRSTENRVLLRAIASYLKSLDEDV